MKLIFIASALLSGVANSMEPHPVPPAIAASEIFNFVVFGDNRGDDSGQQPSCFTEVLDAIQLERPAFVLDSGDMIYGHASEEKTREEWRIYQRAAAKLTAPVFHVPGNHDLWDRSSALIYRELWGPTYHAFTVGNSRFIGLDTETVSAQIDDAQFYWLKKELQNATTPNIFVFMHRPLFPVGPGIGSSLDAYPIKRDRLHELFRQHRNLIRAVFAGHEHLFHFQERDGIRYYISGGGGAPLYTAPELGGFHHFLNVHVAGKTADVSFHKVCAPTVEFLKPLRVVPGAQLESWEQGQLWYAWDHSAMVQLTQAWASEGHTSLRLNFDLAQYAWPVLVLPFGSVQDLEHCSSIDLDVYVPQDLPTQLSLTTAVQGTTKHQAPPVLLNHGWNSVRTPLAADWVSAPERRSIASFEWSLSAKAPCRGYILFDNFRALTANNEAVTLKESWERPLLWRVFDESVRAEIGRPSDTNRSGGLLLHLDWAECNRPLVFAQLNPPWDLTDLKGVILHIDSETSPPPDLSINLAFRSKEIEFSGPGRKLTRGINEVMFKIGEDWLPEQAREAVEQIAFRFVTRSTAGKADLRLVRLNASGGR